MNTLFGSFFEDKKVLITGHTGFIGSWLSIWLNELNAQVIGFALPPYTKKDNFVATKLKDKIINHFGDVREFTELNKIFKIHQPDIVFHLAAQPIVRKSYKIPKETYDINVGGSVNIFEAFRRNNTCRVLINVTTDKCYENRECLEGYKETDQLGGYDPYSSSKACSELITSAYRNSFFNIELKDNQKIISSVRCGNIIGGGDWQEDRLIPDYMRAIEKDQDIIIRNPKSIRPWQFVLEPIRGLLTLTKQMWENGLEFSSSWNFGPTKNSVFSVEEIIKKLIQYTGKGNFKKLQPSLNDTLHETNILLLDCNKSKKKLGWYPILTIEETIKYVCDWYLEDKINYDFDVKQINNYTNKFKNSI